MIRVLSTVSTITMPLIDEYKTMLWEEISLHSTSPTRSCEEGTRTLEILQSE